MKLFRSAETKFQRIEDLLDESMTDGEKGNIQEKYQARIKQEIKEDIVKYGYLLDDKVDTEIDTLVKSVLNKRIENWFKRLQRKT
jgi:predicted metal-dependent RNase